MSMSIVRPPQAKHSLISCDRHPGEPITGFCAPCLSERLSGLDYVHASCSSYPSFSELRRTKSFSGNHLGNSFFLTGASEPRRKSCDVRASRNTLYSLFSLEDGRENAAGSGGVHNWNLGLRENVDTVFEEGEEDEIRVLQEEENVPIVDTENVNMEGENAGQKEENAEDLKTMKEHIDLESKHRTSTSNSRRNMWVMASVFSKKLMTWRQRQKIRLVNSVSGGEHSMNNSLEVRRMNVRETQSEIAEYGLHGRRSCDTDPRFSVDGGRVWLDCPRLSFDQPRASYDGLVFGRGLPRRVIIDERVGGINQQTRSPRVSAETREYYLESLSRRSFDQSGLDKRSGGRAAPEVDEIKALSNSNSKVSPTTMELFHGARVLLSESDLTESNLSRDGHRNDGSESTDTSSSVAASVTGCGNRKGFKLFGGWRKAWTIWESIQKRNDNSKHKDVRQRSSRDSLDRLDGIINGEAGTASNARSDASSLRSSKVYRPSRNSSDAVRSNDNERREHFLLERNKSARLISSPLGVFEIRGDKSITGRVFCGCKLWELAVPKNEDIDDSLLRVRDL